MNDPSVVCHSERVAPLLGGDFTPERLDAVERLLDEFGVLSFPDQPNGLYPAVEHRSSATTYTGYQNTWLRDTVHIAHARLSSGDVNSAGNTSRTLLRFMATQRHRLEACISGSADRDDPMQRPHVRFDGETLDELDVWWPHAQNDALGYTLWFCSRVGLMGLHVPDEGEVAVMRLLTRYFEGIAYWRDADSGHWEEHRKLSSSSVGCVVAGLRAFQSMLLAPHVAGGSERALQSETQYLDHLIAHGHEVLERQLPAESVDGDHGFDRGVDAALLFLIEPLQVVEDEMADRILANVERELLGPHGIRRYRGDSYWMADYKRLLDEDVRTGGFGEDLSGRDALLKPDTEAQWCLFDPLVSVIAGRRYLRSGDPAWRERQEHYFRRALGQLTGADCPLGEGLCAEAYYLEDSTAREPRWVCNDDAPLLWTQALLVWALHAMRRSRRRTG